MKFQVSSSPFHPISSVSTSMSPLLSSAFLGACLLASAQAQQQSDFYLREEIPLPQGEVMELGSIALMPDQKIAPAHITHGSVLVYTVHFSRCSLRGTTRHASRTSSISAWRVTSPPVEPSPPLLEDAVHPFRALATIFPVSSARTAPNGMQPAAEAHLASSIAAFMHSSS